MTFSLFKNKKSQAALEYLQTYGWAILVVLVVGIAIWQLGILGPKTRINTASGFGKIRILDPSIKYSGNQINFTLINAAGTKLKIIQSNGSGDCSLIWLGPAYVVQGVGDESTCTLVGGTWMGGECWRMSVVGLEPGEGTYPFYVVCNQLYPKEQFEVHLIVTYDIRVGKDWIRYSEKGVMRGYAE